MNNHKVKIYPQTAPEIPTGESSIGWEAGGAGWATVPPHHPPRGSCTVTANSPGSPRLRKQGPGKGGGCHRGWSGHQQGPQSFSSACAGLAQPGFHGGGGLECRGRLRAESTDTLEGACFALVPSYDCSFFGGGSSVSRRGSGDAKALGEVAAFFKYLLASLPVAWMGTIIAF